MQVRLNAKRQAAGLGDWRGRVDGSPHSRTDHGDGAAIREEGGDGASLSPAALAQPDIGFGPVKNAWRGSFGVTH
jgi:hypothetical protein